MRNGEDGGFKKHEYSKDYLPFWEVVGLQKGIFYEFFKKALPARKSIQRNNTKKALLFKEYFTLRDELEIHDVGKQGKRYPYAKFYEFQGALLLSPSYKQERDAFFQEILSYIIKKSPPLAKFLASHPELPSLPDDFSLRMGSIYDIYILKVSKEPEMAKRREIVYALWGQVQYQMLMGIVVHYFKKNPTSFSHFWEYCKNHYQDFLGAQAKELLHTQEKKRNTPENTNQILTTLQQDLPQGLPPKTPAKRENISSKMIRPEEEEYMSRNAGEIGPPNRKDPHFTPLPPFFPDDWRMEK